jgi:hypothetical protein
MDENESDQALRRRAAQLNEAIDGDGPRRPPLAEVLAVTAARRPADRGVRTALAPGLAAAGIVVVVLAIALSGFTRGPVVPVASSPVASSQPPSTAPTAATATLTATPAPTPTPTTDPRAVPFATGPSLGNVLWAPDGKTFAVLDQIPAVVHFFSRAGKSLGDIPGRNLAWIDATRYILLRWPDANPSGAQAFIGRVGQTVLTQIPGVYGEDLVGNRHGAVALVLPGVEWQYVLWSNGEMSKPRAGDPVSWSKDGQELALLHIDHLTLQAWAEVVGLSGQRLAAVPSLESFAEGLVVLFSADGHKLALSAGPGRLPFILDIATSRAITVGTTPLVSMAWASDTRLLTVPEDPIPRSLDAWDIEGKPVQIPYQPADRVSVSSDGAVAILQESTPSIVLLNSPTKLISLPGSPLAPPVWSPDGKVAIVICYYSASNSTEAFFITP